MPEFHYEFPPEKTDTRPKWGRHLEFVLTCVGFAVGLGNVWRFPHKMYSNGGGTFFIPYVISLVFMGIPLFALEILFGQFASRGPVSIWTINPLFKGLGWTWILLSYFITIYYNVVIAHAIYLTFASMKVEVPWASCANDWNTCDCREPGMNATLDDSLAWLQQTGLNCTGRETSQDIKLPTHEYYYNHVTEQTASMANLGYLKWDLTLCNLLAWIILYLCLARGVKTLGKVAYLFAILPYLLLAALVVRGLTLEGASKGVQYYLNPDMSKLADSRVWKAAAAQIFFSLSCCTGSLTAMASYNKFNNNVIKDAVIIPIINCCTSFIAGLAIFSVLGFMSQTTGSSIADVTTSGPGLVFVAYPAALAEMPWAPFWSVCFFSMVVFLGFGTNLPSLETFLTGLQDEFSILRRSPYCHTFRIGSCVIGFLLGLPQTTQGGMFLVDLCDFFIGWPLILCGLLECISIVWIYTPSRLFEDINLMIGDSHWSKILVSSYFRWTLVIATPLLLTAILVFDIVDYEPIISDEYPVFAEVLGWTSVIFLMMWTPIWYFGSFLKQWIKPGNPPAFKLFIQMNQPTREWGPRLIENRTIPRYQGMRNQANGDLSARPIFIGENDDNAL